MLNVDNISLYYGAAQALRGVSIAAEPGKVMCVLGRNGVGKTSLLRAMVGQYPIASGSITFDGTEISGLKPYERARRGIGFVPQGRDIFPHLTIEENLQVGLVVHGRKGAAAKSALERVFALFPVLKEMLKRKGGVLSGGQQQQLAIGRALLTNPKLLILDEPTEGIQPSIIEQIGDTLKKLKTEGFAHNPVEEIKNAVKALKAEGALSILLVEQYVDFCREVADRFYAMDRGAVVISGAIDTLTDEVVKKHLQV